MSYATLVLVAAVKGSVLLVAAWLLIRAFPRLSAAVRHLVWASALGGLAAMPLLVRVVPSLESRFVPAIPVVTSIQTTDAAHVPVATAPATTAAEHPILVGQPVTIKATSPITPVRRSVDLERLFPLVWAIVALVLLARIALGRLRLALLARDASVVDSGEWLLLAQRLAHRLEISRPITLLQSRRSCVPMTWGLIYPTVLLPADAGEWTDERRTIVLLHELAHVNRLDAFTQFVAQFATAVFWFNPLVWLAARAMRVERELACDDCVLASGARPSDYAQDLLQIARTFSAQSNFAVAALAMARRGDLEERLLAILDPRANRSAVSRARFIGASLVILTLSIPLAALSPAPVHAAERSLSVATGAVKSRVAAPLARDTAVSIAPPATASSSRTKPVHHAPTISMPAIHALTARADQPVRTPPLPTPSSPSIATVRKAPDRETLISVAHAAKKLTSSFDKAELLVPIAKYYLADDELASAYVAAASSITADFECSRAFTALLDAKGAPSDGVVETAMNVLVHRNLSDFSKRQVIAATLGDGRTLGPDARRALIAAIATINSSFDRRAAISSFVIRRQFNEQDAIGLINAAAKISGSFDRAETLIEIASHHGLDDAVVRQAYIKATESISSSSDYRRAVEGLIKRP